MFPVSVVVSLEIDRMHYFRGYILALSTATFVFPVSVVVSLEIDRRHYIRGYIHALSTAIFCSLFLL